MNAPVKSILVENQFQLLRCDCIDNFALLESEAIALLSSQGIKSGGEPFGHKIDAMKSIKASPTFSKQRHQSLAAIIEQCEVLNAVRNDLVHSRLLILPTNEGTFACFLNARQSHASSQLARLFSLDSLTAFRDEIAAAVRVLRKVRVSPASSPPRPSPDAATGP